MMYIYSLSLALESYFTQTVLWVKEPSFYRSKVKVKVHFFKMQSMLFTPIYLVAVEFDSFLSYGSLLGAINFCNWQILMETRLAHSLQVI